MLAAARHRDAPLPLRARSPRAGERAAFAVPYAGQRTPCLLTGQRRDQRYAWSTPTTHLSKRRTRSFARQSGKPPGNPTSAAICVAGPLWPAPHAIRGAVRSVEWPCAEPLALLSPADARIRQDHVHRTAKAASRWASQHACRSATRNAFRLRREPFDPLPALGCILGPTLSIAMVSANPEDES